MAYCNLCDPVKADEIKRRGKVEISIRLSLAWGLGMPLPLIGSSHISKIRARNIGNKRRFTNWETKDNKINKK